MKTLIAYFSATGTTKKVAEKIKEVVNGDLFEIVPKKEYTSDDLDWTNENSRSSVEMKNNIKPEILNKVENMDEYDVVIIGFPVWWYKEPTIIDSFIEENNLESKKIYIFVTSGSSSADGSFNNLKNTYTNMLFVNAKRFSINVTVNDINDLVEK